MAGYLSSSHGHTTGSDVTLIAETGFSLASDPDTVRAPDAAYVSRAHFDAVGRTPKFWSQAPDFAVEVVSPDDNSRYVRSKALHWLDAGTKAVLVLDPRRSSTAQTTRSTSTPTATSI